MERGINNKDIAQLEAGSMKAIINRVPEKLLKSQRLKIKVEAIREEILTNHCTAIKQSIVDYILMDPKEQERLLIPPIFEKYSPVVCRAPVPWTTSEARTQLENHLFITNIMTVHILEVFENFKHLKIVDMSVFTPAILPISVDEFSRIMKDHCHAFKSKMLDE